MEYRILSREDIAQFRQLRAIMLADTPMAFIASLEDEAVLSDAEWESRIGPSDDCLIVGAFAEGELKGSVGVFRQHAKKTAHKATIWGVYVDRSIRGRGAARSLMQLGVEQASRLPGIRQIMLNVTSSNAPAFRLYSSLGFTECGDEPDAICVDGQLYAEKTMYLRVAQPASPSAQ